MNQFPYVTAQIAAFSAHRAMTGAAGFDPFDCSIRENAWLGSDRWAAIDLR